MNQPLRVIATAEDRAVTVRFSPGLLEKLDKEAVQSGRSRNSEIIVRLLSTFENKK